MLNAFPIDKETGVVEKVAFLASPHCDDRPHGAIIDLLVIHNISLPPGQFGSPAITSLFLNQLDYAADPYFKQLANLKVSAHLLIERKGCIKQFVPLHRRAWHAGESYFKGRTNCNDFSIGIELEGTDTIPYTETQYQQLSLLTLSLIKTYPAITTDRIVGHNTIAPQRKTDPGQAFDWTYFYQLLQEGNAK